MTVGATRRRVNSAVGAHRLRERTEDLETLVAISNLLLVLFTGVYVFLTYMLLRQTVAANKTSQEAIEKQFRIQTSPSFYCSVTKGDEWIAVTIYNPGAMPLYDVDVLYVALYNTDDIDVPTFVIRHVRQKYRNSPLRADAHGFFGVRGYAMYPVFPQSRKVSFSSRVPKDSDFIYVLLQLRDVLGIHYSQLYSFAYDGASSLYRLISLDPSVVTPAPRVKIEIKDERTELKTVTGEPLPPHVAGEDFASQLSRAISEGWIEGPIVFWEDRGEWANL